METDMTSIVLVRVGDAAEIRVEVPSGLKKDAAHNLMAGEVAGAIVRHAGGEALAGVGYKYHDPVEGCHHTAEEWAITGCTTMEVPSTLKVLWDRVVQALKQSSGRLG